MTERVQAELELVRSRFRNIEFRDQDHWARITDYPLPPGWGPASAEVAFQIPPDIFAQQPYGFWVRPALSVPGGAVPANSSGPVATGFGEGFQQFSWAPEGWAPGPEPRAGSNMLNFVSSFSLRLAEIG
jgi:hypothetical protein